uniref:NVL2 nucleolin binding domain-containing protein n=1 Tax=Serinus canaria TaxID=9135 RepID=A0A8C9NPF4_SERCA
MKPRLFPAPNSSFQYLASSKCGQYVDIGILASDLQKTYRLWTKKKKCL